MKCHACGKSIRSGRVHLTILLAVASTSGAAPPLVFEERPTGLRFHPECIPDRVMVENLRDHTQYMRF
jgi:hypothetical protein